MAGINLVVEKNLTALNDLGRAFPALRRRFMSGIGESGARTLAGILRSGEAGMTLRVYPRDSKGKRTTSYQLNVLRGKIMIYSYPLNLFERGRMLRSGTRARGIRVYPRRLQPTVESRLQGWVNHYDKEILQPEFNKA